MQAISALLPAESRVRHEPTRRGAGAHQATSVRAQLASATTRAVNAASRRLGRGQGTVAGGRAGLRLDPQLLEHLSAGRQVALVTGTNGKTTTTRLLTVALGAGGDEVVSNETGSNMPPGHVAALAGSRAARAVLEVDEIYLPRVLAATAAAAVVLLNLSRDQLDRTNEVRMVAGRWRAALAAAPHTHVVANADDPLVAWGAGAARDVHWVGAGLRWQLDAVGCPACEGRIEFAEGAWSCARVRLRPPRARGDARAPGGRWDRAGVWADGRSQPVRLALPGRFNQANAAIAAVAAEACGVDAGDALRAMEHVEEVAGRFTVRPFGEVRARLMLAKNPAGWDELLDLVAGSDAPLVVSINARMADGADPSWLWDVPFERLAGRTVVATGDRYRDLSVRLHYAGVAHTGEADPVQAVARAADGTGAVGRRHRELHGVPRPPRGARVSGPLRIAVVYPDLLGTYGDGGNGLILARRAEWRGLEVDLLQATSDARSPRPTSTASAAARTARRCGPPARCSTTGRWSARGRRCGGAGRVRRLPGRRSELPRGRRRPPRGRGSARHRDGQGSRARAVGEVVAEPRAAGLPVLTGFENHGGRTTLREGPWRWRGSPRVWATATAAERGRGARAAWSGPTCTGRCWPATRRWPTCCSPGRSETRARPARRRGVRDLRQERLGARAVGDSAGAVGDWFVLVGVWLALAHVVLGGAAVHHHRDSAGVGNFKLAAAISALGKEIVPASDPVPSRALELLNLRSVTWWRTRSPCRPASSRTVPRGAPHSSARNAASKAALDSPKRRGAAMTSSSSRPRWSPRRGRCPAGPARRPSGSRRSARPCTSAWYRYGADRLPVTGGRVVADELSHQRHDLLLGDLRRAGRKSRAGRWHSGRSAQRHRPARAARTPHRAPGRQRSSGTTDRTSPAGRGRWRGRRGPRPPPGPTGSPAVPLRRPAARPQRASRIGIDGHRLVEDRCQLDDEDPGAPADIEQASVTVERNLALQRREQLARNGGRPAR